ncbi:DEAD/DEAH box helicase, partial [bacterium]|nr:DEAD/DEAH box helicase [bacterium]
MKRRRRSERHTGRSTYTERDGHPVSEFDQPSETSPSTEPKPERQPRPEAVLADMPDPVRTAVDTAGWDDLMPVQKRTLPYLLEGEDVIVQSRTGSGKTGAFLLPFINRVKPGQRQPQGMVLVPTRELAKQVYDEAIRLGKPSGMRSVAVYGGTRYKPQITAFREGVDLVIGTPGRILDHLLRGTLTLDNLHYLVFDEADRMLSMGFYPDMKEIQSYLPKRKKQSSMFSATYPPTVMGLAKQFLHKPEFLSLSKDQVHVAEVQHVFVTVEPMDKDRALVRILEVENPPSAIIFCNTKSRVEYLAQVLQRFGFDADMLTSDLTQNAREKVLQRIRAGTLKFLVATDVAARGIDIPQLSHVILYEPPEELEAYIHRAGRTGRVGASGTAISLVTDIEMFELRRIAKQYS